MNARQFFINFLKDLRIGAVSRTFPRTAEMICNTVMEDDPNIIVEYGPGDGTITRRILKQLPASGRLIAIETNEAFIHELNKIKDQRLTIVEGSAVDIASILSRLSIQSVNCIFSGIPFSLLPMNVRLSIIKPSFEALANNGTMVVYQYTPIVRRLMRQQFGNSSLQVSFGNIPLYFIMKSRRKHARTA